MNLVLAREKLILFCFSVTDYIPILNKTNIVCGNAYKYNIKTNLKIKY